MWRKTARPTRSSSEYHSSRARRWQATRTGRDQYRTQDSRMRCTPEAVDRGEGSRARGLAIAHIHHVSIRTQPYVVSEVPADVVRVIVDDDLVRIPEPVVAEVVIVCRDAEIEAVKPETIPPPASQPEDVAAPDATGEASVLPGAINVVVGIVTARIMSHPLVVCVHVRSIRMSRLIRESAMVGSVFSSRGGFSGTRRLLNSGRRRTMSWNVPTTNTPASSLRTAASALCRDSSAREHQKSD